MTESLVLVGPSLGGYHISEETRRRISEAFVVGRERGPSAFAACWLEDPFWATGLECPTIRQKLRKLLTEAFNRFSRLPRTVERREPGAIQRLSEISVPTLVIIGERDSTDNHAIAVILESGIAGAARVTKSGAGYMLSLEKPGEFNWLALGFLSRVREGRL